MNKFFACVALLALVAPAVKADSVLEIDTQMAVTNQDNCDDCDDCGMDGIFGNFEMKICGPSGCCNTGELDNRDNNFNEGAYDVFSGENEIGECWLYELGDLSVSSDVEMTLYHSGTDAGTLEWAQIVTNTNEIYRCYWCQELDGNDYAYGTDCIRVQ